MRLRKPAVTLRDLIRRRLLRNASDRAPVTNYGRPARNRRALPAAAVVAVAMIAVVATLDPMLRAVMLLAH